MDWDWGWAPNVRRVDVRKSFVVREILRRLFMVLGLCCRLLVGYVHRRRDGWLSCPSS
jgi:hypothetical protein